MNKNGFIDALAKKNYTKKAAGIIINDVLDTICEAMAAGEDVQFYGFGTFAVRESIEREAIDFQTKERITIPAHNSPKFIPGNLLKKAVKEGIYRG